MMKYIIMFGEWLVSFKEPVEITPVWCKKIKCVPVLGHRYTLTVRNFQEILELSNEIKGDYIHIGGGAYHLDTILTLIRRKSVTICIHETGSCLLFVDKTLPELSNGFASTFLFKELIVD